jgi:hypothetical protein
MKRIFQLGLFIFLGSIMLSSCLKTKKCNIEITEKSWFPYSVNDTVILHGDSTHINKLTFTEVIEFADDEISEQATCQASAVIGIHLTDTSDNTSVIGQYLLYKKESGNHTITQSSITFRQLDFYQLSIEDEEVFLAANQNPLERLDSLSIADSTYQNVYHISDQDSARISYSYYSDIYFSETLQVLRYDIRESGEVFEISPQR